MVQSLDVSTRPTFSQIAQQFEGVKSDNHLRLKEGGDGGKTLYTHTGKFSLTGHGMLTKQATIMERRNEATNMVIDAFKREFKEYGPLVNKVLQHVMSEGSFEKHTDINGEHLQLRTSDIGRLREMMMAEIKAADTFKSEGSKLSSNYSSELIKESLVKGSGMKVQLGQTAPLLGGMDGNEIHASVSHAMKEVVAEKAALAFLDPNMKNILSGDGEKFMKTLQEHSSVMLTRGFMEQPGLTSMKPLLGAVLAVTDWKKPGSNGDDFALALLLSTGSPPTSPRPEPGSRETLVERRMNEFTQSDWAANELRGRFFGETNPLGLHPEKLSTLRNKLDELDRTIDGLKSRLNESTSSSERDSISGHLSQAVSSKLIALQEAIKDCTTTMLESRHGIPGNPIGDGLRVMTNAQALLHARLEHDELGRIDGLLQQRV